MHEIQMRAAAMREATENEGRPSTSPEDTAKLEEMARENNKDAMQAIPKKAPPCNKPWPETCP